MASSVPEIKPASESRTDPPGAGYSRFDTEHGYRSALISVLRMTQDSLCILDRDLQRMPLHTPECCEILAGFLHDREESQINIALHNPELIPRNAQRLLVLRDNYPDKLHFRRIPETLGHLSDSHLLADLKHGVRRFHHDFPRGSLLIDNPDEVAPWWYRFEELWKLSHPIDHLNRIVF